MGHDIKTIEHDVLVIGAGGAGLRAAIECSAHGLDTAVICKSLLGKAHTVMAEGGMAAALRNADDRDNWAVHFRDTMRGSKFLANWRMAELHARQAPDRVQELEEQLQACVAQGAHAVAAALKEAIQTRAVGAPPKQGRAAVEARLAQLCGELQACLSRDDYAGAAALKDKAKVVSASAACKRETAEAAARLRQLKT